MSKNPIDRILVGAYYTIITIRNPKIVLGMVGAPIVAYIYIYILLLRFGCYEGFMWGEVSWRSLGEESFDFARGVEVREGTQISDAGSPYTAISPLLGEGCCCEVCIYQRSESKHRVQDVLPFAEQRPVMSSNSTPSRFDLNPGNLVFCCSDGIHPPPMTGHSTRGDAQGKASKPLKAEKGRPNNALGLEILPCVSLYFRVEGL